MKPSQSSVIAVALLTQGVAVGMTYGILPVFLEPLEAAFEAPRTEISIGQILMMLALTVGSITTGVLLDRGHARRVMLTGALMLSTALFVASRATNLWMLGSAAAMAGFAVPSIGPLAAASLITRAFHEDRGRALGVMSMGPPLGAGLFAALAGWLLLSFDWREVYLLFSGVALVVLVPVIALIVPARFESASAPSGEGSESADLQTGEAGGVGALLRRPTFWWTAGIFALATGIATGWTVHVAAYLGGLGLAEAEGSTLLALQYWMGVPGALVFGMLADRVSLTTLFVAMLGTASAVFAGFATGPSPLVVSGLCIVSGFVLGGVIPLYMLLLGRRMGPDALGRAMGLSNVVMLPVMAGAVLLAASNYESEGGYGLALSVFSVGLLAAIGCLFVSNWSVRTR